MRRLVEAFKSLQTEKEIEDFLRGILTPKELDEICMRLEIVKKLKQGTPQQEIAKILGVGVATVTRGSRELKNGRFKYI